MTDILQKDQIDADIEEEEFEVIEDDSEQELNNEYIDKSIKNTSTLSDSSIKDYINKISSYKHLTKEEEYEVGKKIQSGDKDALNKLITSNLKFVVSIANKYRNSGLSMGDIINQGNLGLVEAAKRFDPDRGVKFISYAVWWIRQAIIQALAEQSGAVKLPIKQASILYKINEATEKLTKKLHRDPTNDEIAEFTNININDIESIIRVSKNYFSLESPIKEGEDKSFIDLLESKAKDVEEEIIHNTLRESLSDIVDELEEREVNIIKWRFGLDGETPKTLEEVGEILKISRERVRQIESRALGKLRKKATKRKLYDFLN